MQNTYLNYLLNKSCVKKLPVSGTMELTGRCNFGCKMCFIHQSGADSAVKAAEMPTDFWCRLADELQKTGTLTMLLTGGEPMLRTDFAEIYTYLKRHGFLISVNTNLSLLTDRTLQLLSDNKPLIMNVSLYGASDETYGTLCGKPEAFRTVRENLLRLKQQGIAVKLNYTVTEENYADRSEIYAFAKENGFPIGQTTYLFPPVRSADGCGCGYLRSCPERAAQMLFDCERLRYGERFADFLKSRRRTGDADDCGENRMACRAGVSSFWVTYDGYLQTCGMMDRIKLDLHEKSFAELWQKAQMARGQITMPQACLRCEDGEFCEICAAVCNAENSFDEPPTYMCRKAREYRRLAAAFFGGETDEMER